MSPVFTLFVSFAVSAISVSAKSSYDYSSVTSTFPDLASCLSQPSFFSCENTTAITNTCCSPTPGGLVLQTQFWSTYTGREEEGQLLPKESWTIHGLWPDNCDGSYEQYCDPNRQFDPIPGPQNFLNGSVIPPYKGPGVSTFIKDFGRHDLLDYMNKYWINQGYPNEYLWAHEFSKHATCTSTFDIACYGANYKEHQDVINYFDATIRAFHQYPTYDMLAAARIVPSNQTTYTLAQLQGAIKSQTGAIPYFGCQKGGTVLAEVWYFSHVYGTEQYGTYKMLDSMTRSSCSATGPIQYSERTPSSEHEVRRR